MGIDLKNGTAHAGWVIALLIAVMGYAFNETRAVESAKSDARVAQTELAKGAEQRAENIRKRDTEIAEIRADARRDADRLEHRIESLESVIRSCGQR